MTDNDLDKEPLWHTFECRLPEHDRLYPLFRAFDEAAKQVITVARSGDVRTAALLRLYEARALVMLQWQLDFEAAFAEEESLRGVSNDDDRP